MINVSILIKSFQTSCPINHFSFYCTNIYIVTNDNKTGVKDLTVWVKQNPKCTLNWIIMPHLDLMLSVSCSQRERTNRHS